MVRSSMPFLAALIAVSTTAPASATTRVAVFSCHIGDGRMRVLVPRNKEESSDDEMVCRAVVTGLSGRSARDLAVELRILPPVGAYRVVGTGRLEATDGGRDRARIDELLVPHATWVSAVDWHHRTSPRVRLVLRVLDKPSPWSKRWRLLAMRRLDLGGAARRR